MAARRDVPEVSPASVVTQAYNPIANSSIKVLADDTTRQLTSRLNTPGEDLHPWLDQQLASFAP
jgi:hypothetical protein